MQTKLSKFVSIQLKLKIHPQAKEHYSGMWKTLKHQAKHHNNWFEKTFARTYEGTSKS